MMRFIETYSLVIRWHLWYSLYMGRGDRRKERERVRNGGERGTRSPSCDTNAMCADETGRCAKPGFDRHLSSYQRAPEELQRPGPRRRSRLRLGINTRITSASYHGPCRVTSYGRFSSRARDGNTFLTASPSDTCEWAAVKCQAALSRLILSYL